MDRESRFIGGFETVGLLDDSTVVAVPFFGNHRAVLLHVDGTVRDSIGRYTLVDDGAPTSVVHELLYPAMAFRPSGGAVAIGTRYAGRIDILRSGSRQLDSVAVPLPFPPIVDQTYNGAIWVHRITGRTTFGYLSVAATDSRIYGLFSGRSMSSCHQCAWYGDQVHVFSWSGALLDVFDIDADASAIAAGHTDDILYAVVPNPEPTIRQYQLKAMNP
jgi:hypothetical protein